MRATVGMEVLDGLSDIRFVAQRISTHKMSVIIKKSQVIFVPSEAAHGGGLNITENKLKWCCSFGV